LDLEIERIKNHKREKFEPKTASIKIDEKLDYKANVVNQLAKKFYEELGAKEIESGFELQKDHRNKTVMTCKYCIKDELGLCPFDTDKKLNEPLYLVNETNKYQLVFNCKECLMEILST
jgi:putative protease